MEFDQQLVASTQGRLADLGYYRLRIDGIAGVATENAMARFKEAHGLRSRAYPGPVTLAALWSHDAKPAPRPIQHQDEPLWLTEARSHLGTREVRGRGNNPEIMKWARDLDQWYTGDDVPWCGLFVAHCMAVGAPDEPQKFNRLGAREWLKYGHPVSDDAPLPLGGIPVSDASLPLGGIAVFWRESRSGWKGHVALITGWSDNAIRCIGGNQANTVSEAWFKRSRLLGVRYPKPSVPSRHTAPKAETGQLSTNEA